MTKATRNAVGVPGGPCGSRPTNTIAGSRPKSGPGLCTQTQRLTVSLRTMARWARRHEMASAINNLSAAGRQFERMPVLGVSTSREALLRCVQPSPLKRRTWPRYCRDGAAGSGGLSGSRSMRAVCFSLVVCVLGESLAGTAHADDFMKECLVTSSQKMCECISAKLPADKRAAAIDGLRKSNAATQPGGNPIELKFTQEQMQGLDAVVAAQASCM